MNEDELKILLFICNIIENCPKEHLSTFLLDIITIKDIKNDKEIKSLTVEEAEHIQKQFRKFRKNVLQQIAKQIANRANRDILKPTYEYGFKKEDFYNLPFHEIITDKNLNNCYCKIEQI